MIVFKIDPPNTGRLGNQLFQIAATLSHAEKVKDKAQFTTWEYNKYMINPIDDNLDTTYDFIFNGTFHESLPWLNFHYIPLPQQKNIVLMGFFQSEKYFIENKQLIIKHLKPKNDFLKVVREAGREFLNLQNTVAIHVRRGDYLQKPDCHPFLGISYYQQSITTLCDRLFFDNGVKGRINFVVFSDDPEWCKQNITVPDDICSITYVSGNSDIVDLYLMAQCNHHIIANSSFSWWGAWLANNMFQPVNDPITIAPNNWFGPSLSHYNTIDLLPENWIKI